MTFEECEELLKAKKSVLNLNLTEIDSIFPHIDKTQRLEILVSDVRLMRSFLTEEQLTSWDYLVKKLMGVKNVKNKSSKAP